VWFWPDSVVEEALRLWRVCWGCKDKFLLLSIGWHPCCHLEVHLICDVFSSDFCDFEEVDVCLLLVPLFVPLLGVHICKEKSNLIISSLFFFFCDTISQVGRAC
jgi:hypothetical protein